MPTKLEKVRGILGVPDPILTSLAQGYTNAAFVGDNLFPIVSSKKEGGKYPVFGKESFLIHESKRALKGRSNRIEGMSATMKTFQLEEHDLAYPLDYREIEESRGNGMVTTLEQYAATRTSEGLNLEREKIQSDIVQNTANFISGHSATLTGTDKFSSDSSDPIKIIKDAKQTISNKIGVAPNVLVMGQLVWDRIQEHPKLIERIKYAQVGVLTDPLLKTLFGVENIFVGRSKYGIQDVNLDISLTDLWSDNIVLAYTSSLPAEQRSEFEMSFGYTFRKEAHPWSDQFEEEGGKIKYLRTTDNYDIEIVCPEAGFLIKDVL